jgi:hypothetical protein
MNRRSFFARLFGAAATPLLAAAAVRGLLAAPEEQQPIEAANFTFLDNVGIRHGYICTLYEGCLTPAKREFVERGIYQGVMDRWNECPEASYLIYGRRFPTFGPDGSVSYLIELRFSPLGGFPVSYTHTIDGKTGCETHFWDARFGFIPRYPVHAPPPKIQWSELSDPKHWKVTIDG